MWSLGGLGGGVVTRVEGMVIRREIVVTRRCGH